MAITLHPKSGFTKAIIVTELILVTYLLYTLTLSVYKSYQIDLVIKQFESENVRIAEENTSKAEDLAYFTSPTYVEKIAKRNLGLVKPGESVIVMPKIEIDANQNAEKSVSNSDLEEMTNVDKWRVFLFDINR